MNVSLWFALIIATALPSIMTQNKLSTDFDTDLSIKVSFRITIRKTIQSNFAEDIN